MLSEYFYILFGWLPTWFIVALIICFSLLVIVGIVRLIVWIIEIIPGF